MTAPLLQVIALVDGFNFYYAVRRLGDDWLKWCDISDLVSRLLAKSEPLAQTRYYTAYPPEGFGKEKISRHKSYVAAVKARGGESFTVEWGRHTRKTVQIRTNNNDGVSIRITGNMHEEKETDVRIAVDIMDLSLLADKQGERLTLVLVSGDTDLRPAIVRALERFSSVSFVILLPPGHKSEFLRKLEKEWPRRVRVSQIKLAHIVRSRMPDSFEANGDRHDAPAEYRKSRWPEVMDAIRKNTRPPPPTPAL